MSGPIPIEAGEAYDLTLTLHDGDDSMPKRVFVDLRRADHSLIEPTFEIGYVGDGTFKNNSKIFPSNVEKVYAHFKVTEPDGLTFSELHGPAVDLYKLTPAVELPDFVIPRQKVMVGEIKSNQLVGVLKTNRLTGNIRQDGNKRLVGELENTRLTGQLRTNRLRGEVRE